MDQTPEGHRFYPPSHYWEVDHTRVYPSFVCSCGMVRWSPGEGEHPNPWWALHAFAVSLERVAMEAMSETIRFVVDRFVVEVEFRKGVGGLLEPVLMHVPSDPLNPKSEALLLFCEEWLKNNCPDCKRRQADDGG